MYIKNQEWESLLIECMVGKEVAFAEQAYLYLWLLFIFFNNFNQFCLQNFVDLAGSEKAGENTGDRLREGCSINKSLFTLGNVISKLSDGEG